MIRVFSPNDNRLDICTAYVVDEYGNILLRDTYEKQKEDTYEKADSSSKSKPSRSNRWRIATQQHAALFSCLHVEEDSIKMQFYYYRKERFYG